VLPLIERVKGNVIGSRRTIIAGTEITYAVFRQAVGIPPDGAWYDTDGALYIANDLLAWDAQVADLIAYHEYEEVRHKKAGRAHAYAHRRANLAELLAARHVYADAEALRTYLRWRIGSYPAWKGLEVELVAKDLERALLAQPLRKGQVLQVITDYRL
jgi:hypothetical protein